MWFYKTSHINRCCILTTIANRASGIVVWKDTDKRIQRKKYGGGLLYFSCKWIFSHSCELCISHVKKVYKIGIQMNSLWYKYIFILITCKSQFAK